MSMPVLRRIATLAAVATASTALVAGTAQADAQTRTSLSIRAQKTAIAPGGTTKVTGWLKVAKPKSAAGKPVTLEAKASGETAFTPIAVTLTGAKGAVKVAVTPATTTKYRWEFAGDAGNRPSHSGVATVKVRVPSGHHAKRLASSLSIRAKSARVALDGTDVISGRLRSHRVSLAGKSVLLLSKEHGATKWSFEAARRTNRNGHVRFVVRPTDDTRYRLAFLGTANFRQARSGVVHVAARPNALSIAITPRVIDPGATATVAGVLTHDGLPFSGQTVELKARPKGATAFTVVDSGVTAADGSVSFSVTPTVATRYYLFLPRTDGVSAARSVVKSVVFKSSTSLSIRGKHTATGYAVSGSLRGAGHALKGRLVTLEKLDGATWVSVKAKRTGTKGRVSFDAGAATDVSYRLSFAGGAKLRASTSGVVVS
ncbi:MAG: hypothetical protein QM655_05535 [Nocardioidaceae bacterium]